MQLACHAQPDHDHDVAGEDVRHPVSVHAGGQHLDQRHLVIGDLVGYRVAVGGRHSDHVREATVDVAPDQSAARADMLLVVQTGMAGAAVIDGVDQHALARLGVGRAVEKFADHLVAHDDGLWRRDSAGQDLLIRPADARACDLHQSLALVRRRLRDILQLDDVGFRQHHCTHGVFSLLIVRARTGPT